MTGFPLYPGCEVRVATSHPLSNGKLARVVSLHDWGAVLETNFGTRSYRAAWHEMEPVVVTELVNPEANGHAPSAGILRNHTIRVVMSSILTGDACSVCQGVNLVRTGTCVTCQDCGANEGCG